MNSLSTVLPATVISLKSQDEVPPFKSGFINPTDCFVISPISHSQPSSFVNLTQLFKKTMKSPSFVSENHMFHHFPMVSWCFLGGPPPPLVSPVSKALLPSFAAPSAISPTPWRWPWSSHWRPRRTTWPTTSPWWRGQPGSCEDLAKDNHQWLPYGYHLVNIHI